MQKTTTSHRIYGLQYRVALPVLYYTRVSVRVVLVYSTG
jgi:hypothetical protein